MSQQLLMAEDIALPAHPRWHFLKPYSTLSCGCVQLQHVQHYGAPAVASPDLARTPGHAYPALTCVHSGVGAAHGSLGLRSPLTKLAGVISPTQ